MCNIPAAAVCIPFIFNAKSLPFLPTQSGLDFIICVQQVLALALWLVILFPNISTCCLLSAVFIMQFPSALTPLELG